MGDDNIEHLGKPRVDALRPLQMVTACGTEVVCCIGRPLPFSQIQANI